MYLIMEKLINMNKVIEICLTIINITDICLTLIDQGENILCIYIGSIYISYIVNKYRRASQLFGIYV